jgi:hypothetical protein
VNFKPGMSFGSLLGAYLTMSNKALSGKQGIPRQNVLMGRRYWPVNCSLKRAVGWLVSFFFLQIKSIKTLNNGRLGLCNDERRSDLRQAMASRRTS